MYAAGFSVREIKRAVKKQYTQVAFILDHDNYRERHRRSNRESMRNRRAVPEGVAVWNNNWSIA